jgi:hypothetical protein
MLHIFSSQAFSILYSVKMCSSLNFDKCTTVRPRIINYISNERNLKILSRKVKNLAIQTKLIELDYSKDTSYMLHIFSSQAFSILFLSVVVLKCVNINIEVHSFKNIVHFIMVNINFCWKIWILSSSCLHFDVWSIFGII